MQLTHIGNLFRALLLKKKIPFLAVINLTNRCMGKCRYCMLWKDAGEEMGAKDIFSLVNEVKLLGGRWIGITGGDPLLRDDINTIVDYIKSRGLKIQMSLDSGLIIEKKAVVEKIDMLQLSVDGPPDINDLQRYKGSYDNFLKAMDIAKEKNIKFHTLTVLTKFNRGYIDYILGLAEKNKFFAFFQPVTKTYFIDSPLLEEFKLTENDYRAIIEKLINLKQKQKYRYLGNSLRGLNFLLKGDKGYECFGARCFTYIHSNGDVYPCWAPPNSSALSFKKVGFKRAFNSIPEPDDCLSSCNTASCIEFNYSRSFSLKNMLKKALGI